jgi:predicted site-specific integrase-resolvase
MTAKRVALYVRVSTDGQTVDNQLQELRQIAERRGWEIVETYSDAGISGAKPSRRIPMLVLLGGLASIRCSMTPDGASSMSSWRGA